MVRDTEGSTNNLAEVPSMLKECSGVTYDKSKRKVTICFRFLVECSPFSFHIL